MSDLDIKKACIIKHFPEAKDKLDDAEEVYVNARFDSVLEIKTDGGHKDDGKKKKIGDQRLQMGVKTKNNNDDNKVDADKSRENMIDSLVNNWKAEPASK